ncbi:MAG: NAD(P)H-quinone oxidoreductase [Pseudomonadota bacterium]
MTLPKTMKAIEITEPGGPEKLAFCERPVPVVDKEEVLIKIHAAGVNRPEVLQRLGMYPPPPGATDIPGLECAGEIVAVGTDVDRFRVGERVCALLSGGSYAEYASVNHGAVLPIPEGFSFIQAAAIPETFFTVYANVFDDARLKISEMLLVHGATSGIGVTAITLAKAMGARVFTTAGSAEKCAAAEKLGADKAFNYKEDAWEKEIEKLGGADVVLDMAGGDFVARNLEALNFGGRHVSIAFLRGMEATINVMMIMRKQLRLSGSTMKARGPHEKARLAHCLKRDVWPLFEAGKLAPVLDQTFPLAAVADAHRRMEAGDHIGKIVLKIADDSLGAAP